MKVVYLAKHKCSAARSLQYLVQRDCDIPVVVVPPAGPSTAPVQRVDAVAQAHGIPVRTANELQAALSGDAGVGVDLTDVDLVVSFLYWRRIRPPLLGLGRIGCINFHPAPLPDFRGLGGYNVAIWEQLSEWGVSAHFVDAELDTGDLIAVQRFDIDPETETAWSLDCRSQRALESVFRDVVDQALAGTPLPRSPQGPGRYVTRAAFEALRSIDPSDGPEEVGRRIRAFWYPPHEGATTSFGGKAFTVIDQSVLDAVAIAYATTDDLP